MAGSDPRLRARAAGMACAVLFLAFQAIVWTPVASAACTVWTVGGTTNTAAFAVSVLSGANKKTVYLDGHSGVGRDLWLEDNSVAGLQELPRITCQACGSTVTITAVFPGDAHLEPYDPEQTEPMSPEDMCG